MSRQLEVRLLAPRDLESWSALNDSSPTGSIYSSPDYLECLCGSAGGRFDIVGVFKGAELLGGVALYIRDSRLGRFVSSRLLLYYNGPVLRSYSTHYPSVQSSREVSVLSQLARFLSKAGFAHIELHGRNLSDVRPFAFDGWHSSPTYTYVVDIRNLEVAWGRVEQNLKRLIKRCEKHGCSVTQDDDFESFFRLHYETHKRKHAPLYLPRKQFHEYYQSLKVKHLAKLYHVRLPDGRVAASQLVLLGNHPVSHTVCAGADEQHLNLGTTPFLRWKVFEDLSNAGFQANDLTSAWLNPVTRFKSQLGGDLTLNFNVSKTPSRMWRLAERARYLGPVQRVRNLVVRYRRS